MPPYKVLKMNISLNWLKDYVKITQSPEEIGEILTAIGLEVEGEEEKEEVQGGLRGVVVGEVKTCGKHPDADRLSLTTVDVGGDELLPIVCGAPNVAAGQKVLVATVGTMLYTGDGESFKIKKGKIRGQASHGMICAEDELGLGESHDGIMVLDAATQVGINASDYFSFETDYVYDIGLTPNRSDATNHLGVAKDLAAYLKVNESYTEGVNVPDVSDFKIDIDDHDIEVVVEDFEACPRFAGVVIKNIQTQPSPAWMKTRLEAIGVKSINNVVDITNFILHELGQPLHAYDLDKIKGNKIIVKTLAQDTLFTSLDGVERKLNAEDLMVCDGEESPMCIGGVFGGLNSGVTDETTSIFLEAAHFNAGFIRRSSMRHNLRTDAAKVFEKGSDPNMPVFALKRAAMLIKELADGVISSNLIDIYPEPIQPVQVEINYAHVARMLGIDISHDRIIEILKAMEMEIVKQDDEGLVVAVPTNKADVLREADVIEEVLRIYGFNNIPTSNTINTAVVTSQYPDPRMVRNSVSDLLAGRGFNEMMAVSLSQSKYYKEVIDFIPETSLVYINNTSNVHLDIMRPEMLMSGLEAILFNQNYRQTDVRLFEIGRAYTQKEEGYQETEHLTIFMTGKHQQESWLGDNKKAVDFYTLKAEVDQILAKAGIKTYQKDTNVGNPFVFGMKYHRGPQTLVEYGKVSPAIVKKAGISQPVFYAVFNWKSIFKAFAKSKIIVEGINKFPTMRRDLALVVENVVKFDDIAAIANKTAKKLLKEVNLFDVYENEQQLGKGKKSYAVSFIFENPERTLKDKEVDKVMNQLIQLYENKLGALIRR